MEKIYLEAYPLEKKILAPKKKVTKSFFLIVGVAKVKLDERLHRKTRTLKHIYVAYA